MSEELSKVLPARLPRHRMDPDAVMVCRRLQEAGHETYLVGGSVRDIIIGRAPKDFDIGTLATPSQIRRLFRNSRIIGRRFKLAHIVFGSKIIEVATFRGGESEEDEADGEDLLIRRANNFGTPFEDALSRDFTVNALFYDPIAERVIDHVDGYPDLRKSTIRTIGPPEQRFREDPVRILRAVKFASRLGFHIEDATRAAMGEVASDILRCPVPRVTEELYRIAESGHLEAAVRVMAETSVLEVVLPEIAEHRAAHQAVWDAHLAVVDHMTRAHGGIPRDFLMTLLFYPLALDVVREAGAEGGPAWARTIEEWFKPIGVRMHVAVKHRVRMRGLLGLMGRFLGEHKRRGRIGIHDRRILPQALTLLRIHHRAHEPKPDAYQRWAAFARENGLTWVPISEASTADSGDSPPNRRRRGRRRGGRGRGGRGASPVG